jgi:hypothetical protein
VGTTATSFINKAKSQVGTREGAGNDNPYGRWYGMNNQPYCAIGLSWTAAQAGAADQIGGRWAYCPYWAEYWRKSGRWHLVPERGDIVFFDWSGLKRAGREQHVGVVTSVSSGNIRTIEFNTGPGGNQSDGDGVWERSRSLVSVVGAGRPLWVPEMSVVPVPAATVLVVDGVWGPRTTRRLQQVLGVRQSGVASVETLRALATWLRQKPLGTFTFVMKIALQDRVGVPKDGVIGPVTVKALQRYLNRL